MRMRDGTVRFDGEPQQVTTKDFDAAIERIFFSQFVAGERQLYQAADFSQLTNATDFETAARKVNYLDAPKPKPIK